MEKDDALRIHGLWNIEEESEERASIA